MTLFEHVHQRRGSIIRAKAALNEQLENRSTMRVIEYAVVILAIIYPGFAMAEHQGSLEDQLACTPDVYRLCAAQVPNEDAIVACLERNKPSLSTACRRVFSEPAPGKKPAQSDDDDDE